MIRVFRAVQHPVVIGVGVQRVAGRARIGVSHERQLQPIVQPITIGVGQQRIGPVHRLIGVQNTVSVRVQSHAAQPIGGGLEALGAVVAAQGGVRLAAAGTAVRVPILDAVQNAAVIRVGIDRARRGAGLRVRDEAVACVRSLRSGQPDLGAVLHAIPVRIRRVRIGLTATARPGPANDLVAHRAIAVGILGAVDEPVVVGVVVQRIGRRTRVRVTNQPQLQPVLEPVAVRICRGRVGTKAGLLAVGQAVAVRVR